MRISNAIASMRTLCALRHLSIQTEKAYTHWLRRYGWFLRDRSLERLSSERKLESFLTRLALSGASASTQNQAFNALLCFYRDVLKRDLGPIASLRAKRPAMVRHAPTVEEVDLLLANVTDLYGYPTRLIVHLLYACGLRVSEPLNLRLKDVDLTQNRLYLHQAKGNKGRVVLFPQCLAEPLRQQMAKGRAVAAMDDKSGLPVALPGLLGKKYPWAARSARWAWLFPSHTTCRDPRGDKQVRWRCHEANVQRAVRTAAIRCDLPGLSPHLLRHAFATHALRNGAMVRDVQVILGHASLETTMGYLHPEAERVQSPLRSYAMTPVS